MSIAQKPGRTHCEVPFCRRTAPATGEPGHQVICGKHWRLANRTLTRRYKRLGRRFDDLAQAAGGRETERLVRLHRILETMWVRIKQQVIERAMGISA